MFYVQPIARHPEFPERLLLRGQDDRWYVWAGEGGALGPAEINEATARWFLGDEWLLSFPVDGPWFHVDDLPLAPVPHPARRA